MPPAGEEGHMQRNVRCNEWATIVASHHQLAAEMDHQAIIVFKERFASPS